MSKYVDRVAKTIVDGLAGVPKAQPAMVAGYWANRQFWLDEFSHLVRIANDYPLRVERMQAAHDRYAAQHGGTHNRDEFGEPFQVIGRTTTKGERKRSIGEARNSLQALADRVLNLKIADLDQYEDFVDCLRNIRAD